MRIQPLEKQNLIEYHKKGPKFINDIYIGKYIKDLYIEDNDTLIKYFDNIIDHELCNRHLKYVIKDIIKELKK